MKKATKKKTAKRKPPKRNVTKKTAMKKTAKRTPPKQTSRMKWEDMPPDVQKTYAPVKGKVSPDVIMSGVRQIDENMGDWAQATVAAFRAADKVKARKQ